MKKEPGVGPRPAAQYPTENKYCFIKLKHLLSTDHERHSQKKLDPFFSSFKHVSVKFVSSVEAEIRSLDLDHSGKGWGDPKAILPIVLRMKMAPRRRTIRQRTLRAIICKIIDMIIKYS